MKVIGQTYHMLSKPKHKLQKSNQLCRVIGTFAIALGLYLVLEVKAKTMLYQHQMIKRSYHQLC